MCNRGVQLNPNILLTDFVKTRNESYRPQNIFSIQNATQKTSLKLHLIKLRLCIKLQISGFFFVLNLFHTLCELNGEQKNCIKGCAIVIWKLSLIHQGEQNSNNFPHQYPEFMSILRKSQSGDQDQIYIVGTVNIKLVIVS